MRKAFLTSQQFKNCILRSLDIAFAYLDDILFASSSTNEHLIYLAQLFERLNEFGIILNLNKCVPGDS